MRPVFTLLESDHKRKGPCLPAEKSLDCATRAKDL